MSGQMPLLLIVALLLGGIYYLVRRLWPATEQPSGSDRRRRQSLLTEAAAISGTSLIFAGAGVWIGEHWQHLGPWEHVAIFAVAAVLFLAFGLLARLATDRAWQRLAGPAWFASAAFAGTSTGIATNEVLRTSGAVTTVTASGVVALYSTVLWLVSRKELQLVAVFAGLIGSVCGAMLAIADVGAPWLAVTLGLWMLGAGWAIVGGRYPEPLWTSAPLGVLLALAAPGLAVWQHGWVYLIAFATAAAAMAASVPLRNVLLLGIGTLALFGYATSAMIRYFHATLGLAATLSISGAVLLALAAFTAGLRQPQRPRPPAPGEQVEAAEEAPESAEGEGDDAQATISVTTG
jgi:hypothetical protein